MTKRVQDKIISKVRPASAYQEASSMRLRIFRSLALLCLSPTLFAAAQDIAVHGIQPGMTMEEAQAKLPPGLHISTTKTDFSPQFTTLFAEKAPLSSDDLDNEGFTIEAVDGKVAYVKRIVTYSPGKALDRQAFTQSLTTTYGPISPYPQNATPAIFPVWVWNHSGKLVANSDSCPVDLTLAKGAAGFYRPVMISAAPGKENRAGCNVILSVLFDRRTDRIPSSKLDWVEYTLTDYNRFLNGVDKGSATGKVEPVQ
jgi:hypothetical protein